MDLLRRSLAKFSPRLACVHIFTAALIMTVPDNPTGRLAGANIVRSLCDVARRHDLIIISDEIYRDLIHDPNTGYISPAAASSR